jgi:hypothetical protein
MRRCAARGPKAPASEFADDKPSFGLEHAGEVDALFYLRYCRKTRCDQRTRFLVMRNLLKY